MGLAKAAASRYPRGGFFLCSFAGEQEALVARPPSFEHDNPRPFRNRLAIADQLCHRSEEPNFSEGLIPQPFARFTGRHEQLTPGIRCAVVTIQVAAVAADVSRR